MRTPVLLRSLVGILLGLGVGLLTAAGLDWLDFTRFLLIATGAG